MHCSVFLFIFLGMSFLLIYLGEEASSSWRQHLCSTAWKNVRGEERSMGEMAGGHKGHTRLDNIVSYATLNYIALKDFCAAYYLSSPPWIYLPSIPPPPPRSLSPLHPPSPPPPPSQRILTVHNAQASSPACRLPMRVQKGNTCRLKDTRARPTNPSLS